MKISTTKSTTSFYPISNYHAYYLRARYYDHRVGRFTQEDIYRGDGLNLYAYVKNNPIMWVDLSGYIKHKTKDPNEAFDIVNYGDKTTGLENHHGILDVWATKNIPGYKSRANASTAVALTKSQHSATKKVYREWLREMTGKPVGGKINWTSLSLREIQNLSERMFDAADVPQNVRNEYYSEFTKYLYGLL